MSFRIDVRRSDRVDSLGTWAIAVRIGDTSLTRLLRLRDNQPDDYILAPPAQLAFWLIDNWWRIRWECIPSGGMTPEWRIAHELSSVGGGYAWPRLAFWGEDDRIGMISRSDPPGVVGPVRYLCDALMFVQSEHFVRECDEFIHNAVDDYAETKSDRSALRTLMTNLELERKDPDISLWRQLEARLGFDPGDAPDSTMETLAGFAAEYGRAAIDEAATAMPGEGSGDILRREIEAANDARVECDFRPCGQTGPGAGAVRAAWAVQHRRGHGGDAPIG